MASHRNLTLSQAHRLTGLPIWYLHDAIIAGVLKQTIEPRTVIREEDLWRYIRDEFNPADFDLDDAGRLYRLKNRAEAILDEACASKEGR